MCKGHILRFSCGHGLLMGFETCPMAPCPILRTISPKLPCQPYRCYNCERKRSATSSPTSSRPSCGSSVGSFDSASSMSSVSSDNLVKSPTSSTGVCSFMTALPGVAKQPSSCIQYARKATQYEKAYKFTCSSSNHYPLPHYSTLPSHLPHQNHDCPQCQLENMRLEGDR